MKIPLPHAEEIIGARGENIEFIRSASGAVVILEEIGDYPEEVLVMIKGSPSQVQTAYELLQEVLSGNREPPPPPRICYRDARRSWATAAELLPSCWRDAAELPAHWAEVAALPPTTRRCKLQQAGTSCHGTTKMNRP
jgi:hypothetical protein